MAGWHQYYSKEGSVAWVDYFDVDHAMVVEFLQSANPFWYSDTGGFTYMLSIAIVVLIIIENSSY
jgi:hypothetical protein